MCMGGGGGSGGVPQAPNTAAQSSASSDIGNMAAGAGASQLAWAQGQVGNNSQTNQGVQQSLTPQIGTDVNANAAGAGMYASTLGGLGQQMQTAQNYGNQAGQDQASAGAQAATGQAFDAARQNNMRQLGSYGVDPSQMKSGALNLNANMQQAGAQGNAGFQAGQQRQLTGMGLVSNALNQNMMGAQVGQGYGAGANATGAGVAGIGNSTLGANSSALSAPSQMLQTGLSGESTSANIQNQQFQDAMQTYGAQQKNSNSMMSGIGSLAGMAGGAMIGGPMGASIGAKLGGMAGGAMADGGAIPGRYDNGGSVPVGSNVTPVMGGGDQHPQDNSQQPGFSGGLQAGLNSGAGQAVRGAFDQHQANAMLPQTNRQMSNDQDMQMLQNPQMQQPEFGRPQGDPMAATLSQINAGSGDGTIRPGFADGGQTKRMDYGNPGVIPSRGVPPQVGVPGPWMAANGGAAPPGMIQHGQSDGTGIDDQVHAKVSVGEYIIPADVVHAKGKEFFDMLLKKYHVPAQQQRQQMGVH